MKKCKKCKDDFPFDHYHKNAKAKDGSCDVCRKCRRQKIIKEANEARNGNWSKLFIG